MQVQVDLDKLDQNAAVNKAGQVVGQFAKQAKNQLSDTALQPYDEVFGLQRFRETELIHGRWVQNVQKVSASHAHTLMPSFLQPYLFGCALCVLFVWLSEASAAHVHNWPWMSYKTSCLAAAVADCRFASSWVAGHCACGCQKCICLTHIWLCRWAMLATLGVIVAEASTGVSW